jgi:hypothetical protein
MARSRFRLPIRRIPLVVMTVLAVPGLWVLSGCGGGTQTVSTAAAPVVPPKETPLQKAEARAKEIQNHKEEAHQKHQEEAEKRTAEANTKHEEVENKAREAKTQKEEESPKPEEHSGAAASGGQTVPGDLVGKSLPAAESELEGKGIQFSSQTINGDMVILKSDWGVCSTTPGAGESVSGSVVLHLGHFQCGA